MGIAVSNNAKWGLFYALITVAVVGALLAVLSGGQ